MNTNNHGGKREGSGRPKSDNPRGQHQVRAAEEDWAVIKEFTKLLKLNPKKAYSVMEQLKK